MRDDLVRELVEGTCSCSEETSTELYDARREGKRTLDLLFRLPLDDMIRLLRFDNTDESVEVFGKL